MQENVIGQRWEVYNYDKVKTLPLKKGEMVVVNGTGSTVKEKEAAISLIGDGKKIIAELYTEMVAKFPPQDSKQPKITATGAENLLTAPETVGGQPGTIPIDELTSKIDFVDGVQSLQRQIGALSPEGLEHIPALLADLAEMPDMLATEVQARMEADTALEYSKAPNEVKLTTLTNQYTSPTSGPIEKVIQTIANSLNYFNNQVASLKSSKANVSFPVFDPQMVQWETNPLTFEIGTTLMATWRGPTIPLYNQDLTISLSHFTQLSMCSHFEFIATNAPSNTASYQKLSGRWRFAGFYKIESDRVITLVRRVS
jgi:hypothetical protein